LELHYGELQFIPSTAAHLEQKRLLSYRLALHHCPFLPLVGDDLTTTGNHAGPVLLLQYLELWMTVEENDVNQET
jgi:hypothetical protein